MPDPREWISGIKVESPPDLWSAVMERADAAPVPEAESVWPRRPSMPRRAAFVTGAATGILALTLVVFVLRGPADDSPTPTPESTALDRVHQRLEDVLSQLWIAETQLLLHQGELEVAQEDLRTIIKAAGATPTEAEQQQIETAHNVIEAITVGIRAARGEIELLRPRIEQLREARAGLLPPSDTAAYPDVVTVRCGGGDGDGGTHVSTSVVRARADGTHVRVVNAFQGERARLLVDDVLVDELSPGTTADVVLPARRSGDVEVLCTYDEPPFGFTPPSHPLWIVSSEGVAGSCPAPPFTLSRLPWLDAGAEIPAPEQVAEGESSLLVWFEDTSDRWEGRHVSLKRSTRPLIGGSLTGFPTVSVRGQKGHLVWVGDPGVGELSVVWKEPSGGACSWYSLTLSSREMSQGQAESEIQRIAASLEAARSE